MSSRNIKDCVQELQDFYPLLKASVENEFPGYTTRIVYTHRTPEEQFELFKIGREYRKDINEWVIIDAGNIVTKKDGKTKLSKHNAYPAKAFDVAIQNIKTKEWLWNKNLPHWAFMAGVAKQEGIKNGLLLWGWDEGHFEV